MNNLIKKIKNFKGIIIDIDNTILNYNHSHNLALEKVLKKYNFTLNEYNRSKYLIKKRNLKSNHHKKEIYFKMMCEEKGINFSLALDMYEYYCDEFLKNLIISNKIAKVLEFAKENNIKVIAVTNYYTIPQIKKLRLTNLINNIDYLITSEEFEEEKPSEKIIKRVLELSGLKRCELISIGDSESDVFDEIEYYPYSCNKLFISISGKSGSGKTTLANLIKNEFSAQNICTDGYHKYERNSEKWKSITHYNPDGNNLVQLSLDIKNLYYNYDVNLPFYNHDSGKISNSVFKNQNYKNFNLVVIEGLHTLYPEIINDFVKIKIFIDSDVSDNQKIERDITNRSYEREKVIDSILKREEDYKKYIEIQKQYSNFIIEVRNGKYEIIVKDLGVKSKYYGEYKNLLEDFKKILKEIIENEI